MLGNDGTPTLLVVGQEASTEEVLRALGALLDLEVHCFLSGEGVLDAWPIGRPAVLVTEFFLPGLDAPRLLQAVGRSFGNKTIILTRTQPAFSPTARTRLGFDAVVTRQGAWPSALAARLIDWGHRPLDARAQAVLAAMGSEDRGFRFVADALIEDRLPPKTAAWALRYLVAVFPPDRVLGVLEGVLRQEAEPRVFEVAKTALGLAVGLGGAGLELVELLAMSSHAEPALRVRAMRHLADHAPPGWALSVFEHGLGSSDKAVRHGAAEAALESARRVPDLGAATVDMLLEATRVPTQVRVAVLDDVLSTRAWAEAQPVLEAMATKSEEAVASRARALLQEVSAIDEKELAALAEDRTKPETLRVDALRLLFRRVRGEGLSVYLASFRGHPTERLWQVAMAHSLTASPRDLEDAIEHVAAQSEAQQRFLLLSALGLGARGVPALLALARCEALETAVRAMAVRGLGVAGDVPRALALLDEIICSSVLMLGRAALMSAAQLGRAGVPVLVRAARRAVFPVLRAEALVHVFGAGDEKRLVAAVNHASRDPHPRVRSVAVRLAFERNGAKSRSLLEKVGRSGRLPMQWAALEGVYALGEAGFGLLLDVAKGESLGFDKRVQSAALKRLFRFFAEERAAIVDAVGPETVRALEEVSSAPDEVPRPSPEGARGAPPEDGPHAADEEKREAEPEAWEVAPTRPQKPASAEGFEAHSDLTIPDIAKRPRRGQSDDGDSEKTVVEASRLRQIRASLASRKIDARRAQKALEAALRMGPDGFRGVASLADSERVPVEIRIQAIRHLGADFPTRRVLPVLERGLESGEGAVQHAALRALMLREDAMRAPVEALATSASPSSVRVRAIRYLASRWSRPDINAMLEKLLLDPEANVRRTALECMFSSLRYLPPDRVEQALINLLREHRSQDVKISAAKALAAFGSQAAIDALEGFVGIFAEPALRDAASEAIRCIQARAQKSSP